MSAGAWVLPEWQLCPQRSSGGRRFGGRRFIIIEATVGLKELAVLGEFAEVSLPDVLAGRHVDVLVRPNEDQHLSGLRVPREARF